MIIMMLAIVSVCSGIDHAARNNKHHHSAQAPRACGSCGTEPLSLLCDVASQCTPLPVDKNHSSSQRGQFTIGKRVDYHHRSDNTLPAKRRAWAFL